MNRIVIALPIILAALVAAPARATAGPEQAPIVYFDLGDVLISMSDENNFRYTPGAEAYVRRLRALGFRLGLITNVPETWGRSPQEKVRALKAFVATHWRERRPFPWNEFGRIVVPPKDAYRKPHPYMFLDALRTPAPEPCKPIYIGEDEAEILTARRAGFVGYWTLRPSAPPFPPPHTLRCIPRPHRPRYSFKASQTDDLTHQMR